MLLSYVILKVGDCGKREIVSVAVSALTTGYSSGTMSYDADADPQNRKKSPDYCGYIPDGWRNGLGWIR